ncbi:MAG TPA: hypothetical protein VGF81_18105 [Solirubrobacteraceae bacterium]|jgi:hypothetical protein
MPHDGQELDGPNGFRLRFVRLGEEVLEMEASYGGAAAEDPAGFLARYADEFQLAAPP